MEGCQRLHRAAEVIAELGVNHQGDLGLALKMVDQVAAAGGQVVKFQTFEASRLALASTPKVEYQRRGDHAETHLDMLSNLALTRDEHKVIYEHCAQVGVEFLSTPYSVRDAQFLDELGVARFKTASADLVDTQLHEFLAEVGKPVLISTGMASDLEIAQTLDIYARSPAFVTLLHAVSRYPTPLSAANVGRIQALAETFGLPVGFSDHTQGSLAAQLAVACGAVCVEKHITLDRGMDGPDHSSSLEVKNLRSYLEAIDTALEALGSGLAGRTPEEEEMALVSRKTAHLQLPLAAGEILTPAHVTMMRPGTGLTWIQVSELMGSRCTRNLPSGTTVDPAHFERV